MTPSKNIEIVHTAYAAFGRGDAPATLALLAEDVDWGIDAKATPEIPWHGTGKGKRFAAAFFEALAREVTFTRFEPSNFVAGGDIVVCQVSFDVQLKKNGRKLSNDVLHHFTFKDGLVVRWRGTEDTAYIKAAWNA